MPRTRKSQLIAVGALLLLASLGYYFIFAAGKETTDDAAIETNVVPIASKISGYVSALEINDNQMVKAGDVLLKVDTTDYEIGLAQAQADLDAARARLAASTHVLESTEITAPSSMRAAQSSVEEAQARWVQAAQDLKRFRNLNESARTRKQLDDAIAQEKAAKSALDAAQAQLRSSESAPKQISTAEANVAELTAAVKRSEANLAQAQQNLKDTVVVAPIDGRVTRRGVETGAYVQPGQQLMSITGNDFWVVANYKETQLTDMKPGQPATIVIDSYPSKKYRGKVDSIMRGTGARFSAFPPENATGNFVKIVQRVPVKILFEEHPDASLAIGPGMSVSPAVSTR